MTNPLISVIMPVYNCENTVAIAIDSILNQTYRNIELIVINDKSTDGTEEVVKQIVERDSRVKLVQGQDDPFRFDVKIGRNVNAGYSARNIGFQHAHGAYITFQDADDASFLNRIEIQHELLLKYGSTHLTLNWVQFDEKYLGKKLYVSQFVSSDKIEIINPKELYEMSQRSKGFVARVCLYLNRAIPFHLKRHRIIHKLFFGSYENYPGAGNSPLFKHEVINKVQFRKLKDRIWPSFMGRGADKDFNFQVAETFKNSHVVFVPLYMWRVPTQNPKYATTKLLCD